VQPARTKSRTCPAFVASPCVGRGDPLCCVHWGAACSAAAVQGEVAAWEERVAELRAAAAARPADFEAALELGAALHQLDHAAPNGGKRLPEAAAAYERAAALAPTPAARAYVASSLGALLLSGGRVEEAAAAMRAAMAQAEELSLTRSELVRLLPDGGCPCCCHGPALRLAAHRSAAAARLAKGSAQGALSTKLCACCIVPCQLSCTAAAPALADETVPLRCHPIVPQYVGTLFNLAKAEQQLGRQGESQTLMRRVLHLARGVAGAHKVRGEGLVGCVGGWVGGCVCVCVWGGGGGARAGRDRRSMRTLPCARPACMAAGGAAVSSSRTQAVSKLGCADTPLPREQAHPPSLHVAASKEGKACAPSPRSRCCACTPCRRAVHQGLGRAEGLLAAGAPGNGGVRGIPAATTRGRWVLRSPLRHAPQAPPPHTQHTPAPPARPRCLPHAAPAVLCHVLQCSALASMHAWSLARCVSCTPPPHPPPEESWESSSIVTNAESRPHHRPALAPSPSVDEAAMGAAQRAAWLALRSRWAWLEGLSGADQSWIGFGLFHAYQQAGWVGGGGVLRLCVRLCSSPENLGPQSHLPASLLTSLLALLHPRLAPGLCTHPHAHAHGSSAARRTCTPLPPQQQQREHPPTDTPTRHPAGGTTRRGRRSRRPTRCRTPPRRTAPPKTRPPQRRYCTCFMCVCVCVFGGGGGGGREGGGGGAGAPPRPRARGGTEGA
jgi:hypothetical protein